MPIQETTRHVSSCSGNWEVVHNFLVDIFFISCSVWYEGTACYVQILIRRDCMLCTNIYKKGLYVMYKYWYEGTACYVQILIRRDCVLCTNIYKKGLHVMYKYWYEGTACYAQISIWRDGMLCTNNDTKGLHVMYKYRYEGTACYVKILICLVEMLLPLQLLLTHWGRGYLNCLNARSRGF
jgi:hypothetical protein